MLARQAWPGESAVGKKLEVELLSRKDNPRVHAIVVGVVAHLRSHDLMRNVREQIYIPHSQETFSRMAVVIKATGDLSSVMKQVEQQVRSLDPGIAVRDLKPLENYVDDARAPMRFNLILIAIFGAIALTLAAVGLYGVMAYSVTQRAHELGIRIAVGASQRDILRLVLGQGVRLTLVWCGCWAGGFAHRDASAGQLAFRSERHRSAHIYYGADCARGGCNARVLPAGAACDARGSDDRFAIRVVKYCRGLDAEFALRSSDAGEESGIYGDRGANARAGHRRKHGHLLDCLFGIVAIVAFS